MDLGPCFVSVCFHVHVYNEKQAQLGVVHRGGPWTGSMGWSMDRVHRGGPWTRVHVLYTSHIPIQFSRNRPMQGDVSLLRSVDVNLLIRYCKK